MEMNRCNAEVENYFQDKQTDRPSEDVLHFFEQDARVLQVVT
jgi:hypothetical protein